MSIIRHAKTSKPTLFAQEYPIPQEFVALHVIAPVILYELWIWIFLHQIITQLSHCAKFYRWHWMLLHYSTKMAPAPNWLKGLIWFSDWLKDQWHNMFLHQKCPNHQICGFGCSCPQALNL
jgi:hypothetical protein